MASSPKMRLRRTLSMNKAEDINKEELKEMSNQPDKPYFNCLKTEETMLIEGEMLSSDGVNALGAAVTPLVTDEQSGSNSLPADSKPELNENNCRNRFHEIKVNSETSNSESFNVTNSAANIDKGCGFVQAKEQVECTDCKHNQRQRNDSESSSQTCSDVDSNTYMFPRWLSNFLKEPEYTMEPDKKEKDQIHRHADSLFSTASGFTNYRGLLNLCILLLALANARLFLENILKYGILIDPIQVIQIFLYRPNYWPNVCLVLFANVFILITYFTERLLSKSWISESVGFVIIATNVSLTLIVPATVILILHPNPAFSAVTCGIFSMTFLKLVSYSSVNKWCRQKKSENRKIRRRKSISFSGPGQSVIANGKEETILVNYPDNLTLKDIYYFMLTPTLCYELNFPRSLRIRKRFLIKRFIEMLFLSQLMLGLVQQWIIPAVSNSMKPLAEMHISRVLERLLKLAVPNHLVWLIFFYWFFHSCLNVSAELLRFGDREFYRDWWNAESINEFWQNWNVPVHRWCVRHLYKPLVRRGCSKQLASVAVFGMSAFFHEYLLSVPLRMFRVWAFFAMLGQVPLAIFVSKYLNGKAGNMAVWLSLILGQPIAIFAYVHDYYVINMSPVVDQTLSA